jgi:hypothetical protein
MDTLNVFDFLDRIIALIKEENVLNPQETDRVIEYEDPEDLKISDLNIGTCLFTVRI